MIVKVSPNKEAIVDDGNLTVLDFKWFMSSGYACAYIDRKVTTMHHLVLPKIKGSEVDHINRKKLDNRRNNLRYATTSQNQANRDKLGGLYSSTFKGVVWNKQAKKWRAQIRINKKLTHLGTFEFELDAARAYDMAALSAFGEFAVLNFRHVICT